MTRCADAAEKELDKVRRDPANKVCPNCLKEDKLGFDAVCFQFKTFVCSACKSAHQGYSHRCKSVRMSNWSKEEVEQLKSENGGGARSSSQSPAHHALAQRSLDDRHPHHGPPRCSPSGVPCFVNRQRLRDGDLAGQPRGGGRAPPVRRW
jgi:hypothetical protein